MTPAGLRRAAIVAVGSELLTPLRADTNSLFITRELNSIGIDVVFKCIVGDHRAELAETVRSVLPRADLLVLCGGLGPTDDDITREVVADVLGRPLREDPDITANILSRFVARGMEMPNVDSTASIRRTTPSESRPSSFIVRSRSRLSSGAEVSAATRWTSHAATS